MQCCANCSWFNGKQINDKGKSHCLFQPIPAAYSSDNPLAPLIHVFDGLLCGCHKPASKEDIKIVQENGWFQI